MLMTNRLFPRSNAWSLLNQMQADFNRELADWFTEATAAQTPLGVWTKEDEAIVAMDLPGRLADEIDVSIHHNIVTIEAQPLDESVPEGANQIRSERSKEAIRRQVQLPSELDPEKVEATYERGLLVVRLTAHESAHPAKIEVKAG